MSYFYVIEHKESGKLYAGSRTAKNCCPSELLQSRGYKTSSRIVKAIIDKEGLSSFKIRFIKEFSNTSNALNWERRFLKKIDAANNEKFLNLSNGKGIDKDLMKATMLDLYGVEYAMQLESNQEKARKTNLRKYGVEYLSQSPVMREKSRKTCIEKYGVDNPSKSEEIKNKISELGLERYQLGYDIIIETFNRTMNMKYGVDWAMQSEEILNKSKNTLFKNYGVDSPMKSEIIKEKAKSTILGRFGVENCSQSEVVKEKKKETVLRNYGVDHYSKIRKNCHICNFESNSAGVAKHIKNHHKELL